MSPARLHACQNRLQTGQPPSAESRKSTFCMSSSELLVNGWQVSHSVLILMPNDCIRRLESVSSPSPASGCCILPLHETLKSQGCVGLTVKGALNPVRGSAYRLLPQPPLSTCITIALPTPIYANLLFFSSSFRTRNISWTYYVLNVTNGRILVSAILMAKLLASSWFRWEDRLPRYWTLIFWASILKMQVS